jgi:hypothetical protein
MSRHNKVNPDHYTSAGRLSPDDLARERKKQAEQLFADVKGRPVKPVPPWMAHEAVATGAEQPDADETRHENAPPVSVEQAPAPKPRGSGKQKKQAARPAASSRKGPAQRVSSRRTKPRSTKAAAKRGTPRSARAAKPQAAMKRKKTTTKKTARKTARRGAKKAKPR